MDDIRKKMMERIQARTREELKGLSDTTVNNARKNYEGGFRRLKTNLEHALPVDEFATMGSDSEIVKDWRVIPQDVRNRYETRRAEEGARMNAAYEELMERGYEPKTSRKVGPDGTRATYFRHPITKKILRVVAPIATGIGALGYSDMAGAAVDTVIPGGVEELGADEEQRELDRRYKERIRQRALREQ